MPKHKTHRYADELLLEQPYGEVHKAIDWPYIFLGRKHRRMFHTPHEAYVIGSLATSDPYGGLAGLLHVWVDQQCSQNRNYKKWIEFSAKQDAAWQKEIHYWTQFRAKKTQTRPKRMEQLAKLVAMYIKMQQWQMQEIIAFVAMQNRILKDHACKRNMHVLRSTKE